MKPIVTRYKIKSEKLREGLRIALVSDLHQRDADDIALLIEKIEPDLILVAGDSLERYDNERNKPYYRPTLSFPSWVVLNTVYYLNEFFCLFSRFKNKSDDRNTFRFFEKISAVAPVFVGLGNHEERLFPEDYRFFEEHGITVLENADTVFEKNGNKLKIGALRSVPDEKWLSRFSEEEGFKLLICHHPEYYDILLADKDFDLIVAGHAHGGQFRIAGRGVFAPSQGLFPKYTRGLYHGKMIVGTGCANTAAVPRLGNPREVVLIEN